MTNEPTDSLSQRIHALIFNGITHASSESDGFDSWLPLSERERFARAVFAELRAGNIEFRLGPLALLAEAVHAERLMPAPTPRIRTCVEAWPECETGGYDPRCCRFPKSCSCTAYDPEQVTEEYLEDQQ